MSVTKEQIEEMDRKAGLPKERYTYVTRTITCEECGQEYKKEFAELTWPHLVGRCYCGAPRIQRSLDSEPEDTCKCDCFFRPKDGAVNLCSVTKTLKRREKMNVMRDKIYEEIEKERAYQDEKWGTDFDKKNTINDWSTYIMVYLARASEMKTPIEGWRKNMVKVATLAVAALERHDQEEGPAKRHYDD